MVFIKILKKNLSFWYRIIKRFTRNYSTINGLKLNRHGLNIEQCFDIRGNIGDIISPYIIDFIKDTYKLKERRFSKPKHLYCVGSIINFGDFDATIWGSGFINKYIGKTFKTKKYLKYDIRAVRGPLSRDILLDNGYDCPKIYGDPAIILPLIYNPKVSKKYKVSIVRHYIDNDEPKNTLYHYINILNHNWKGFVDEILASEIIISSSLHGIIIAESYGIPAIWLENKKIDPFKYYDWYLSTGRNGDCFKISNLNYYKKIIIKDISVTTMKISKLRNVLLRNFPFDLYIINE